MLLRRLIPKSQISLQIINGLQSKENPPPSFYITELHSSQSLKEEKKGTVEKTVPQFEALELNYNLA